MMAATYKTVRVELDSSMMRTLKDSRYSLCFAKKMSGEDYGMAWLCYPPADYLSNNTVSWEPLYQMFGINDIPGRSWIDAVTNTQNITPGQICLLDKYGILQQAVDGGIADSLMVKNKFGAIRIGISQHYVGIRGESGYSPIFVTSNNIIIGETSLMPEEKLLVWFEQGAHTGESAKYARSNAYEVDLIVNPKAVLLFNDRGEWVRRG